MRIQHNIMAMNAYRNYSNNTSALSKNLERLSSGYKINRAGDDAAGLAISEKMRAQITGLQAAQKNVKDGVSLVNTAEGAMQEIQDMLNRMVSLATQSANGTYDNEVDRMNLQKEVDSLKEEINRIADSANFNGIKLLDGSQADTLVGEEGVKTITADMAKGIEVTNGSNGGGTYGEFSIDITQTFGDGDTIELLFGSGDPTNNPVDNTLQGGSQGGLELQFGTDFKGATVEEQAKSLASALSSNAEVSKNFNVTAEGGTVKLTSKNEGNKELTVTNVMTTNTDAVLDTQGGAGNGGLDTAGAGKGAGKIGFAGLFDATATPAGGMDVKAGDTLTFEFKDANGTILKAELEVTDAMIGATTEDTTKNIAQALAQVSFIDDANTVANEGMKKVGDIFDVKPNVKQADGTTAETGSLYFAQKANAGYGQIASATVSSSAGGSAQNATVTAGTGTAAANKYTLKLDTAAGTEAADFAVGDKLTIAGKLSDGREFSFDVEAGKDFEIGTSNTDTLINLQNKLQIIGMDITLDDGTKVKSTDIFGGDKEITVAGGVFTSNVQEEVGKGAGGITGITLTPAAGASVEQTLAAGSPQTSADSIITFSEGLSYGSTIDIDGKTYEIVKDAADVTSGRNIAVVVENTGDSASVAKAFADAYNDLNGANASYKAVASGDKVTIKSSEIGSSAKAASIQTAGDTETRLEFTLDPEKVQAGSTVTINGQKYQFVKKGEADSVTSGAKAIEVDFNGATSKSLADALAHVADGKNDAKITVDADGKITVKGIADKDGNVKVPTVSFANGKGTGLQLQIGDTSDIFNQLKVGIGAMKTGDLGIDSLNIGTQEGAQAAIDVIRNAINYVSSVRGDLGAISNRLDHTANNLSVMAENITDAESTIRDTDIAEEMMAYTKNNILVQSAQAMLAQANQVPQGVLQLLQ